MLLAVRRVQWLSQRACIHAGVQLGDSAAKDLSQQMLRRRLEAVPGGSGLRGDCSAFGDVWFSFESGQVEAVCSFGRLVSLA